MMTKKTRALVAAGAGATVLLASGATFALWSAEGSLGASDIETGRLVLHTGDFVWTEATQGIIGDDFLMVPGDVVTGTAADFQVEGRGDNLTYEIVFNDGTTLGGGAEFDNFRWDVDDTNGLVITLDWSDAIEAGAGSTGDGMDSTAFAATGINSIVVNQTR